VRFLTKTATRSHFVLITYIVNTIKKQKSKPCQMDLPLLK